MDEKDDILHIIGHKRLAQLGNVPNDARPHCQAVTLFHQFGSVFTAGMPYNLVSAGRIGHKHLNMIKAKVLAQQVGDIFDQLVWIQGGGQTLADLVKRVDFLEIVAGGFEQIGIFNRNRGLDAERIQQPVVIG